jgi:hypothetical protein
MPVWKLENVVAKVEVAVARIDRETASLHKTLCLLTMRMFVVLEHHSTVLLTVPNVEPIERQHQIDGVVLYNAPEGPYFLSFPGHPNSLA